MNRYLSMLGFQLIIQFSHAELGNLALHKPTTASSVHFEKSSPANSVDGNLESDWHKDSCFASDEGDASPWLMVDLQGFYKITRIMILSRGDCCENISFLEDFTVETFLQNPTDSPAAVPSLCFHYPGSPGLGEMTTRDCENNVTGRYVRVRSTSYMNLCEIEVNGETAEPYSEFGNLALNKPTTASTVYITLSAPSNSVDGNLDSDWSRSSCFSSEEDDTSSWLMVDLQGFYKVTRIKILSRGDYSIALLKDFTVETFVENPVDSPAAVPSLCFHYAGSPGLGEMTTRDCEKDDIGRYVRVRSTSYMNICEIEVYGEPAVPLCSAFHCTVNVQLPANHSLVAEHPRKCAEICANSSTCLAFNFRWTDPPQCGIVNNILDAPDQAVGWRFFERYAC